MLLPQDSLIGRRRLLTSLLAAAPVLGTEQATLSPVEVVLWSLLWEFKNCQLIERSMQRSQMQNRLAELRQDELDSAPEVQNVLRAEAANCEQTLGLVDQEVTRLQSESARLEQWLSTNRR